jgi:hypothetical protein
MLTICAECKTPQECGIVKGYCPVRLAEAQLASSGGRKSNFQAQIDAYNMQYGRGVKAGSPECGLPAKMGDLKGAGLS